MTRVRPSVALTPKLGLPRRHERGPLPPGYLRQAPVAVLAPGRDAAPTCPAPGRFFDYAAGDVQVTWECHAELARRYTALGLPTPVDRIYSAASIGKAHLDAMGIRPWRDVQPDMLPELVGAILASYYGGRSEVHLRRVVTQVRYCDFLSMYPTVCTLMGLWRFVTASGMTWADTTAETQAFLDGVTLDALQSPSTWRELTTIVELVPDNDLLLVRAKYDRTSYTIGLNYLSTESAPVWYPLADLVNAKLNGEHVPVIRRAISFAAGDPQTKLRTIDLMGNPHYTVDPSREDVFRRIIELRSAVKAEKKAAMRAGNTALADRLDAEQLALKIIANATSYGIFIELNVSIEANPVDVTCYGRAGAFVPSDPTSSVETPGRYFHPLLATLITAAARLMLGIAERLCGMSPNGTPGGPNPGANSPAWSQWCVNNGFDPHGTGFGPHGGCPQGPVPTPVLSDCTINVVFAQATLSVLGMAAGMRACQEAAGAIVLPEGGSWDRPVAPDYRPASGAGRICTLSGVAAFDGTVVVDDSGRAQYGIAMCDQLAAMRRPYLGVTYQRVSYADTQRFGDATLQGTYQLVAGTSGAASVVPGSPADQAGLRRATSSSTSAAYRRSKTRSRRSWRPIRPAT